MAKKGMTQVKIPLCGNEYYFKRCTVETLKKFDEESLELKKKYDPITEKINDMRDESLAVAQKVESINKRIELMEKKSELSDKDIQKMLDEIDRRDKLLDDLEVLKNDVREFTEENKDWTTQMNKEADELTARKVEALIDGLTAEEFKEKYELTDIPIVLNITKYCMLCISGEKESKIRAIIKQDVDDYVSESFQSGK